MVRVVLPAVVCRVVKPVGLPSKVIHYLVALQYQVHSKLHKINCKLAESQEIKVHLLDLRLRRWLHISNRLSSSNGRSKYAYLSVVQYIPHPAAPRLWSLKQMERVGFAMSETLIVASQSQDATYNDSSEETARRL